MFEVLDFPYPKYDLAKICFIGMTHMEELILFYKVNCLTDS